MNRRRSSNPAYAQVIAARTASRVGVDSGLIPILLVVSVLLAFGQSATFDFTRWDNYWSPTSDPNFSPPNGAALARLWARPHVGLYVPVTYTAWWMLAKIGYVPGVDESGGHINPWVFHCANLLVHLLSVAVVFVLARRLIGKEWPACAVALFFALHPVQVESVVWVSGMRDLLAGLLALVALWQYLQYATAIAAPTVVGAKLARAGARRTGVAEGRGAMTHYAIATTAFVAGMFAKPSDVVVPLLAAILDWGILRHSPGRVARSLALWVGVAVPVLIIARMAQNIESMPMVPLVSRPLIAGDALAFYVAKIIWPAHLAPDYGRRPLEMLRHSSVYFIWLVPAAVGIAVFFLPRRWRWVGVAAGLIVVPLLPVLGFTPFLFQYFSTVSDHYLYLAMLGPALALGWSVALLGERIRAGYLAAACAAILLALGIRTAWQAGYWWDDHTLWVHTLTVNPHSFTAHLHLGRELEDQGQFEHARREYQAALFDFPDYASGLERLVLTDAKLGRLDEAEQMGLRLIDANRNASAQVQKRYLSTYARLAGEELRQGEAARAIPFLAEILRRDPDNGSAQQAMDLARRKLAAPFSEPAAIMPRPSPGTAGPEAP